MDRRTWSVWRVMLLGWAGAMILVLAGALLFGGAAAIGTARVLVPTGATLLAMIWAYAVGVFAVRYLDEYQMSVAKLAWYWGASLGLAASVVGYVFVRLGGLHWLDPARFHLGRDLFEGFRMGYLLGVGGPFLGFVLAQAWWRLAKR